MGRGGENLPIDSSIFRQLLLSFDGAQLSKGFSQRGRVTGKQLLPRPWGENTFVFF